MTQDEENLGDRRTLEFLRALGSDMPAPAMAARHVLDRLGTTLAANALRGIESNSADGSSPSALPIGIDRPHAIAVTVTRPWLWAVGLTIAGGVIGGAIHAAFAPEKVRTVYVEQRVERSSPSGSSAESDITEPLTVSSNAPAEIEAAPDPPARGSTPTGSSWSKERLLLDAARRALAAGEPATCLAELAKHARSFPSGKLAEEREALAINALVGVGRYEEARQKADLFSRRYPRSFLAPSVEAAISAIR